MWHFVADVDEKSYERSRVLRFFFMRTNFGRASKRKPRAFTPGAVACLPARRRVSRCRLVFFDGGYSGEHLSFEGFQHGTTAGGYVGYLVGKAVFVYGCYRVAAAH